MTKLSQGQRKPSLYRRLNNFKHVGGKLRQLVGFTTCGDKSWKGCDIAFRQHSAAADN